MRIQRGAAMPHLRFDYSPGLDQLADIAGFAEHMRAAMQATGLFPTGGIRVRGHRSTVQAVADGAAHWLWLDMELRMGQGRSESDRTRATETLYAAARAVLEPQIGTRPFALSLELREIDPRFSAKGWNTIHTALAP